MSPDDWMSLVDAIDWPRTGPWLALLVLLAGGIGLPAGLYALFDRWAAQRLRLDTVALATRYGGFMNSWAVFGRHASEYRDLRPLFPGAQAAELARYDDGTACIAARFRSPAAAEDAARQRFASFAAAGVEFTDAGISFSTGGEGGYARGQWLLIGDTLFAFYGRDSATLSARRRAIPALRARRFPGPLRLLHGRAGHLVVAATWVAGSLAAATPVLERALAAPPPAAAASAAADPLLLRQRLAMLRPGGQRPSLELAPDGTGLILARRADDLLQQDLALLGGSAWLTGLYMRPDPATGRIDVVPLVGRGIAPLRLGEAPAPPERWRSNAWLVDAGDPLVAAARAAAIAAGWQWQPRLWPPYELPGWPWPRAER